jgi:hypothetical protein
MDKYKELELRITKIEEVLSDFVAIEKNNLDRIHSSLVLASNIFGETHTLQECIEEINKLKALELTEIS